MGLHGKPARKWHSLRWRSVRKCKSMACPRSFHLVVWRCGRVCHYSICLFKQQSKWFESICELDRQPRRLQHNLGCKCYNSWLGELMRWHHVAASWDWCYRRHLRCGREPRNWYQRLLLCYYRIYSRVGGGSNRSGYKHHVPKFLLLQFDRSASYWILLWLSLPRCWWWV